jgi:hypothetical protein
LTGLLTETAGHVNIGDEDFSAGAFSGLRVLFSFSSLAGLVFNNASTNRRHPAAGR